MLVWWQPVQTAWTVSLPGPSGNAGACACAASGASVKAAAASNDAVNELGIVELSTVDLGISHLPNGFVVNRSLPNVPPRRYGPGQRPADWLLGRVNGKPVVSERVWISSAGRATAEPVFVAAYHQPDSMTNHAPWYGGGI